MIQLKNLDILTMVSLQYTFASQLYYMYHIWRYTLLNLNYVTHF